MRKEPDINATDWNAVIVGLPGAHILQTWNWGQLKSRVGWNPEPFLLRDPDGKLQAAAMVLRRRFRIKSILFPFSVLYVPRGPLLDWGNPSARTKMLDHLEELVRKPGVIFIKIDPELPLGYGVPGSVEEQTYSPGSEILQEMSRRGWFFSQDQIQFRNTVVLDLRGDEAAWLGKMKQKTRYNLRLAERKGVLVRSASLEDLPWMYQAYAETSVRDGFVIRSQEYYIHLWSEFIQQGLAEGLIAEVEGQAVAGLIQFRFGQKAWYLYGMSRNLHREKMPNYLLQWKAMQRAKQAGCVDYDLWGAPDVFIGEDDMDGVFRFKQGLGGSLVRMIGAWDFTTKPMLYRLYTRVIPAVLSAMRRRRKIQTRMEISL